MKRSILSFVAGLIAGSLVISAVQLLGQQLYPLPAGVQPADLEAMKAVIASAPVGALLMVVLAYALGSLAGGWAAARVATKQPLQKAVIIGSVFMLMGIANLVMLPHPIWFWFASLPVYVPMAYLGGKLATRR